MDTIDQLKQAAREREAVRNAEIERAEARERRADERSKSELYALLLAESPLGREATIQIEEAWDNFRKTVVTFQLPFHADIQATYARRLNDHFDKDANEWMPGPWYHEGFENFDRRTPDKTRQWRVVEWTGTQYDPESETYAPSVTHSHFENLGDALLTAERVFVAQEDIDREVADMNFKRVTAKPVKDDAPEPTTGAQLLAILEKFVTETCDARGE